MAQPNVIWIFGDQHRGQAMGCAGDPNVHTPAIDRMAGQGIWLTDAVAGCPLCSPFRGSLLTGRYPHNAVPGHNRPMPDGMPTVAQPFNEAGYDTAWFGKWHVNGQGADGERPRFQIVPPDRRGGFKTWIGNECANSQWQCYVHGHDGDGQPVDPYRLPGYETDALADLLIDYIQSHAGEGASPFFAALSVQPPHDPYVAPESFMARRNAASIQLRPNVPPLDWVEPIARRDLVGYYAMIENLDWNVGRIRQALADAGIDDQTYVLFFSDHGDMHGSHGLFRKHVMYEESIRIPFIMAGPDPYYEHSIGGVRGVPINHVDIAPTTLGLCDVAIPDWMCGFDYSGWLRRDKPVPTDAPDSAYCQLVTNAPGHGHPWRGLVTTDGWKYASTDQYPWLLFNLNDDPCEQTNLVFVPQFNEKRQQLHARLQRWIIETNDTFTLPKL